MSKAVWERIIETLPSKQGKAQRFEVIDIDEPKTLLIAKFGVDIVTCSEFGTQLVRDEDEVLVRVYCDRLEEVVSVIESKNITAAYLSRGFKVRSTWEVVGDEF